MQDMASMGINLPPIPGTPDPPIPGTPPISQRSSQALTLMLGDGEPPSSQSIAEATELEETLSGLVGEDADAQYGEDVAETPQLDGCNMAAIAGEDVAETQLDCCNMAEEPGAMNDERPTQRLRAIKKRPATHREATGVVAGEDAAETQLDGCNMAEESGAMNDEKPTKRLRAIKKRPAAHRDAADADKLDFMAANGV